MRIFFLLVLLVCPLAAPVAAQDELSVADMRGAGWRVARTAGDGSALAWGPGLPVVSRPVTESAIRSACAPIAASLASDLVGVQCRLSPGRVVQGAGLWYARADQRHHGHRVVGAGIDLRVDDAGRLVAWRSRLFDTTGLDGDFSCTPERVGTIVLEDLRGRGIEVSSRALDAAVREKCFRETAGEGLRRAWRVTFIDEVTRFPWSAWVDDESAAVIEAREALVRCSGGCCGGPEGVATVTGTVRSTTHEGLSPVQPPASTAQRDVRVDVAGTTIVSGSDGSYGVTAGGPIVTVTSALSGPFVAIADDVDPLPFFSASTSSGSLDVVFDDTNSTAHQRDAVHFTNKAHAFVNDRLPTFGAIDAQITALVNTTSFFVPMCNAVYVPGAHRMEFAAGNATCVPMGTLATIVTHEYGHGFTYLAAGNDMTAVFTPIAEGLADAFAAFIENDSSIAADWLGPGTEARNLDTIEPFPSPVNAGPHQRGLTLGGALWAMRAALVQRHGPAAAAAFESDFLSIQLGRLEDEPEALLELLLLDDDDADLTNGTPNSDLFFRVFTLERNVPFPLPIDEISHEGLVSTRDGGPGHTFEVGVSLLDGTTPAAVVLKVRAVSAAPPAPAEFAVHSMVAAGGGKWRVQVPAFPPGTVLEYFFEATDSTGQVHREPTARVDPGFAPLEHGSFQVARRNERAFFADDFEVPSGWISQGLPSPASDDWQNEVPTSFLLDPPSAASGTRVWGTDLGVGAGFDGRHEVNIATSLTSPPINCVGRTGIHLLYSRWLSIDDRSGARIEVSVGGGAFVEMWRSFDVFGSLVMDDDWVRHRVDISSIADGQSSVRLRFGLSVGPQARRLGGWNIDDLVLTEERGPLLTGSGSTQVGGSWTLTAHGVPGDLALVFGDGPSAAGFVPGLGDFTVDPLGPTVLVLPVVTFPQSGIRDWSAILPPLPGWTVSFQAIGIPALRPLDVQIGDVVTLTIQ